MKIVPSETIKEDFIIYICWQCGKTIKWPAISTSTPYDWCPHNGILYKMDIISEKDYLNLTPTCPTCGKDVADEQSYCTYCALGLF